MRLKNSDQTAVREDTACSFESGADCGWVMSVVVDPVDPESLPAVFETPLNSRVCRDAADGCLDRDTDRNSRSNRSQGVLSIVKSWHLELHQPDIMGSVAEQKRLPLTVAMNSGRS